MNKTEAMIEKVKALADASSCCAEAKEAANNWLCGCQYEKQDEAAKALIEEIAADIIPIDGLIALQDLRMERRSSARRRQPESRRMRRRSKQKAQDSVTARHAQRLLRS